jgi:hypothetical protein
VAGDCLLEACEDILCIDFPPFRATHALDPGVMAEIFGFFLGAEKGGSVFSLIIIQLALATGNLSPNPAKPKHHFLSLLVLQHSAFSLDPSLSI